MVVEVVDKMVEDVLAGYTLVEDVLAGCTLVEDFLAGCTLVEGVLAGCTLVVDHQGRRKDNLLPRLLSQL